MALFLMGVLLWGLIIVGIILFIWGLLRISKKMLAWSGAALLIPAIVLSTQQGWFYLFLAVPLAAFAAAFTVKKA
jgi:hypothetical protein